MFELPFCAVVDVFKDTKIIISIERSVLMQPNKLTIPGLM